MADATWVRLGELTRGISVDGEIVLAVQWRPAHDSPVTGHARPAGFWLESGPIARTQLVEEALEPTEDAWTRTRELALTCYANWLAERTHDEEDTP